MRLFHISVLYLRFTKVKKGEYSKQIKFNCSGNNRLNPGYLKIKICIILNITKLSSGGIIVYQPVLPSDGFNKCPW